MLRVAYEAVFEEFRNLTKFKGIKRVNDIFIDHPPPYTPFIRSIHPPNYLQK